MTTNVAKLLEGKGTPPPADDAPDVIAGNERAEMIELRPLPVRIPVKVFEEFSEAAGREFAFSHSASKQLSLKVWEAYRAQNIKV